jgi:uroporphyrinogen decarboxylase
MNSLERIQKSIRGESVDRIPHFPISLASTCQIMGVKQRDFSLDADIMAETLMGFRERAGCDGIYVSRDNWVYHQALGGELFFPVDDESYSKKTVLSSIEEYKRLSIPDPREAPGMGTLLAAAEKVVQAVGNDCYIQANIDTGPFSLAAVLLGAERFLIEIMTADREQVREFLQFCTEVVTAYGKAMIDTGVHGIQFGDSTASLMGPEHFEGFALPWIKKAVDKLAGRGADIWIHICGKTDQFLHLLKDVNFQGFEVDALVPMPLARELLGDRIALKGNLDTTFLLQKTPDEIYNASLAILGEGRFKTGIIFSPGCGVPRNTPLENIQAIQKACEDFAL